MSVLPTCCHATFRLGTCLSSRSPALKGDYSYGLRRASSSLLFLLHCFCAYSGNSCLPHSCCPCCTHVAAKRLFANSSARLRYKFFLPSAQLSHSYARGIHTASRPSTHCGLLLDPQPNCSISRLPANCRLWAKLPAYARPRWPGQVPVPRALLRALAPTSAFRSRAASKSYAVASEKLTEMLLACWRNDLEAGWLRWPLFATCQLLVSFGYCHQLALRRQLRPTLALPRNPRLPVGPCYCGFRPASLRTLPSGSGYCAFAHAKAKELPGARPCVFALPKRLRARTVRHIAFLGSSLGSCKDGPARGAARCSKLFCRNRNAAHPHASTPRAGASLRASCPADY